MYLYTYSGSSNAGRCVAGDDSGRLRPPGVNEDNGAILLAFPAEPRANAPGRSFPKVQASGRENSLVPAAAASSWPG